MANLVRLFVAVPVPPSLEAYLLQVRDAYASPLVRPVPAQNLHLTLYFLGNVPQTEVPALKETLLQVARQHASFTLTLEQVEPGPKQSAPRLIWARFRQHERFTQLSRALTQALAKNPPKHQKFIPHVTLCRYVKNAAPSTPQPVLTSAQEWRFPVTSFALWHSTLVVQHPVYTVVETYALGME